MSSMDQRPMNSTMRKRRVRCAGFRSEPRWTETARPISTISFASGTVMLAKKTSNARGQDPACQRWDDAAEDGVLLIVEQRSRVGDRKNIRRNVQDDRRDDIGPRPREAGRLADVQGLAATRTVGHHFALVDEAVVAHSRIRLLAQQAARRAHEQTRAASRHRAVAQARLVRGRQPFVLVRLDRRGRRGVLAGRPVVGGRDERRGHVAGSSALRTGSRIHTSRGLKAEFAAASTRISAPIE